MANINTKIIDANGNYIYPKTYASNIIDKDTALQAKLSAGSNITIENNVISAQVAPTGITSLGGKTGAITLGTNLSIDENNVLNASGGGEGGGVNWGDIGGTLTDQTDLSTALNGKQATLVSGTNIKSINSTSLLGAGNVDLQTPITASTDLTVRKLIGGLEILTEAPQQANVYGVKIVYLETDPVTKYNGYIYLIKESE